MRLSQYNTSRAALVAAVIAAQEALAGFDQVNPGPTPLYFGGDTVADLEDPNKYFEDAELTTPAMSLPEEGESVVMPEGWFVMTPGSLSINYSDPDLPGINAAWSVPLRVTEYSYQARVYAADGVSLVGTQDIGADQFADNILTGVFTPGQGQRLEIVTNQLQSWANGIVAIEG